MAIGINVRPCDLPRETCFRNTVVCPDRLWTHQTVRRMSARRCAEYILLFKMQEMRTSLSLNECGCLFDPRRFRKDAELPSA